MMKIIVKYGIGYGTHTTDLDFEDDATPEEIEENVRDFVMERVDWSYEEEPA